MASRSLYPQSETNLMSNRKDIERPLQLKSAKAHGKNYIKVKPHLVRLFCLQGLQTIYDRSTKTHSEGTFTIKPTKFAKFLFG